MQLYLETPIPNIAFEKTGFSKLPWSTVIHSPTVWTLSIHGDANYFMAQILWKLVPKSPFSWLISFPLKFCILTLKSNRDMEIEKCVKLFSQSKSNYLHLGQHCRQIYFPWFWIKIFKIRSPPTFSFNLAAMHLYPLWWQNAERSSWLTLSALSCSSQAKCSCPPWKVEATSPDIKGLEISQEMVWSLRLRTSEVKLASCHSAAKKSFWGAKGQTWHSRKHKLREGSL